MTNFESVKKFMETFGQEVKRKAEFPSEKITELRYKLIKEELDEFQEAIKNKNLVEIADSLINLDKCFDEVQRSNMSKLDENGKPIYNKDGKVMKGPNYFKPNLNKIVE